MPQVDPDHWTLKVHGRVDHPFELTFADVLAMPMVEEYVTLQCVSNEVGGPLVGNAKWLGVPLPMLLDRAGVQPERGSDRRPLGRLLHGRFPDRRPRSTAAPRCSRSA